MPGWRTHSGAGVVAGTTAVAGMAYFWPKLAAVRNALHIPHKLEIPVYVAIIFGGMLGIIGGLLPDIDQPKGRARIHRYTGMMTCLLLLTAAGYWLMTKSFLGFLAPVTLVIGELVFRISGHRTLSHQYLVGIIFCLALLLPFWLLSRAHFIWLFVPLYAGYASHLFFDRTMFGEDK